MNLESDLRGLTRPLCHDVIEVNQYDVHAVPTISYMYRNAPSFVEESRASHPAFMYRDLEQRRWEEPFINPQYNAENKMQTGLQTRILEKDSFVAKVPTFLHLS